MLTELLCHATGGPEVVTASGFDEAKLGVPPESWPAFSVLASDAATIFPTPHHRAMILSVLSEHKAELCFGMDAAAADAEAGGGAAAGASKAKARIVAAGFDLQLDCPDLAMSRHTGYQDASDEEFLKIASANVDALNAATIVSYSSRIASTRSAR